MNKYIIFFQIGISNEYFKYLKVIFQFENWCALTFFHLPILHFSEIFQDLFLFPYVKESYFKLYGALLWDQGRICYYLLKIFFTLSKGTIDPICASPCSGTATSSVLGSIKSYTSWSKYRLVFIRKYEQ